MKCFPNLALEIYLHETFEVFPAPKRQIKNVAAQQ